MLDVMDSSALQANGFRFWMKDNKRRFYFNPRRGESFHDENAFCYIDLSNGDRMHFNDVRLADEALRAASNAIGDAMKKITFAPDDERIIKEYQEEQRKLYQPEETPQEEVGELVFSI